MHRLAIAISISIAASGCTDPDVSGAESDLRVCSIVDTWTESCWDVDPSGRLCRDPGDSRTCSISECCTAVYDYTTEQWEWACTTTGGCGPFMPPP